MRRIALYFGIAAGLVASCSTKENDIQTITLNDEIFYASFEQPAEEGTRVYANEDLLLRWTADDRISIFNKLTYNQEYKFLGETGDNGGGFNRVDNAEFVTGNPISHVVSVYPYQASTRISEEEVLTVNLPEKQTYAANSFGLGANTMVSVSEDNVLQYKNVGGYLMLNFYGEGVSVKSVILKGNNGEKLAGKAIVTMPPDGFPSVEMGSDITKVITLTCATPVQLGATAENAKQFWFVVPPVTFGQGFTITVVTASGDSFEKSTTKSITIERNKLSKMSVIEIDPGTAPHDPVLEAVDLGLPSGLKWASFNLGASKPEEYGDYYAWGETEPKTNYRWSTYKWCNGSTDTMTKYCTNEDYGYNGFTDTKTVLDPEDDAAHVNLGGNWRMPTDGEWRELLNNCTSTWKKKDGVFGRYFTSNTNGNSIFLPAAGDRIDTYSYNVGSKGQYWSSSLYTGNPDRAWFMNISSSGVNRFNDYGRYFGFSVRPVYAE